MAGADRRPLLALTLGDCAGIGPEIVIAALADAELRREARMLVVGDAGLLSARARRIGAALDMETVKSAEDMRARGLDSACLAGAAKGPAEDVLGRVDAKAGRASVEWVKSAAALAMAGELDGIVTAPINKQALAAAGLTYEGHTEILGEVTGAEPVMMLAGGGPRVALVTRHVALADVPGMLTKKEIVRTARVVDEALRAYFGIPEPRIAVLALNPYRARPIGSATALPLLWTRRYAPRAAASRPGRNPTRFRLRMAPARIGRPPRRGSLARHRPGRACTSGGLGVCAPGGTERTRVAARAETSAATRGWTRT